MQTPEKADRKHEVKTTRYKTQGRKIKGNKKKERRFVRVFVMNV